MKTCFFTSVSLCYVTKAEVLATAVKRHHPGADFVVVLTEETDADLRAQAPCFDEILSIRDLGIPDLQRWLFDHDVVEACTGVKGAALSLLLQRNLWDRVVYLDPDIAVLQPFEPVWAALENHDIVLTPHITIPESDHDAVLDNELCALQHGVFNLGFLAVRNSGNARAFAAWWRDRLAVFCYDDKARGIFTDQKWVDLAPGLFDGVHALRHPGCNVATWNLSNRRIEGDVANGFLVNGQPLIFYHFSGFDGGAQLTMLQRYGSAMPAAFALRAWYERQIGAAATKALATRPWRYAAFTNGEPITRPQREAYRATASLREQFPDPFETADPDRSYLAWYRAQPPKTQPSQDEARAPTFLERLLDEPAWRNVSPHPWFDNVEYVRSVGSARAMTDHPLVDYLERGWGEGRSPHADFDPDFVREQFVTRGAQPGDPLSAFVAANDPSIRPHPAYDKERDADLLLAWQERLKRDRPTVLHITHTGGGGTESHVRTLALDHLAHAHALMLMPVAKGRAELELVTDGVHPGRIVFDMVRRPMALAAVIHDLGIDRIHVHHMLGSEQWIAALVASLGVPYDITLHDYYLLSPSYHLIDLNGRFVPDDAPVRDALLGQGSAEWDASRRALLARAARVIAPSRDLAKRYAAAYPSLPLVVAAHRERPRPEHVPPTPASLGPNESLRVVILGELFDHKGRVAVEEAARLAKDRSEAVEFHLIGMSPHPIAQHPETALRCHGAYERADLPRLLSALKPHVAWFPAMCPESYCYTLSEAMHAGLPVLVSDLGSLPERIAGRPWSWKLAWDSAPEAWLTQLVRIRDEHIRPGIPPPVVHGPPPADDAFYDTEYLSWTDLSERAR